MVCGVWVCVLLLNGPSDGAMAFSLHAGGIDCASDYGKLSLLFGHELRVGVLWVVGQCEEAFACLGTDCYGTVC